MDKKKEYMVGPVSRNGSVQCKREAKTGRFVAVKNATKKSKGVVKESANKRSAALIRLADR